MSGIFTDEGLGLLLRGYDIVPNRALETTIAVYTPEIVQSILCEHSDIVDNWLQKLHGEYINNKRVCDLENDPSACFNLGIYEEFEKKLRSWEEGLALKIKLVDNKMITISKIVLYTCKRERPLENTVS